MRHTRFFLISLIILVLSSEFSTVYSQPFPIGAKQTTFNDPARSRSIATRIYYPATSAGTDKPFAAGQFPLLVFGHGFSMNYDAYLNFRDSLVTLGYILVFPTTEVGPIPFPSHEDFALDLKFLNSYIKSQNSVTSSWFYQKLSGQTAIMGHSMGGGASILASENNSDITTLILFAPAETDISAITAATGVTVPALVFSGENDGVTAPAETHTPMYNNLGSTCKTFVNILGGGHCLYALSNWACDFGESSSSPQPTITREKQQQVVFNLLIPYLNYILKNDSQAGILFVSRLQQSTDITYLRDCSTVSVNSGIYSNQPIIFPNPAKDIISINTDAIKTQIVQVQLFTILGEELKNVSIIDNKTIDISAYPNGIYYIKLRTGSATITEKLIIGL